MSINGLTEYNGYLTDLLCDQLIVNVINGQFTDVVHVRKSSVNHITWLFIPLTEIFPAAVLHGFSVIVPLNCQLRKSVFFPLTEIFPAAVLHGFSVIVPLIVSTEIRHITDNVRDNNG